MVLSVERSESMVLSAGRSESTVLRALRSGLGSSPLRALLLVLLQVSGQVSVLPEALATCGAGVRPEPLVHGRLVPPERRVAAERVPTV